MVMMVFLASSTPGMMLFIHEALMYGTLFRVTALESNGYWLQ
jgi:hypothetical protein